MQNAERMQERENRNCVIRKLSEIVKSVTVLLDIALKAYDFPMSVDVLFSPH